jgi:hypothetical protein
MFLVALFTIAKLWHQPQCPSMDEWKKKMYYIFTMEYYSTTEKNKIVICREMDETREHVK